MDPDPRGGNARRHRVRPRLTGLMLVPILAYLSTAIASPAIAVTVGLLSRQGLPASLPAFNLQLNFVFWNHALFFLVCWAVYLAPVGRRVEKEVEETVGAAGGRVSTAFTGL